MPDLLEKSQQETVVIAQIEEPEAVDAVADIAAVAGVDGLFVGPADLTVAYGADAGAAEKLDAALAVVGAACKAAGKCYMSFIPDASKAAAWAKHGMTMFFIASEQGWVLNAARGQAKGIHDLGG